MNKKWLLGFIEGSGCFSIIIRKSKNQVGYQTIADFTMKLPLEERPLLESIQSFLKVGRLYESKGKVILKATKLSDAKKLTAFFSREQFVSESKRKEVEVWKGVVDMMDKNLHLTETGVLDIAHLRDSIHLKKLWNKKNYCSIRVDIDPCGVHQKTNQLPEGCRLCWEPGNSLVHLPKEFA